MYNSYIYYIVEYIVGIYNLIYQIITPVKNVYISRIQGHSYRFLIGKDILLQNCMLFINLSFCYKYTIQQGINYIEN